jgi:hypothetical protein
MGLILRQTTTPNSGTTLSVKGSTLTYAEADGNFTYLMTNMSGSRVSITGPTSVTGSLTVSGGITGSFSGSLAGTIAYTQGGNSFGGDSIIGLNDNYSLSINAGTSTRLFVSASGNIGIGTSSPIYKLDIVSSSLGTTSGSQQGLLRFQTTNTNADKLEISNTRITTGSDWQTAGYRIQQRVDGTWMGYMQFNGSNSYGISFGTGNSTTAPINVSERMRIDSNGNVGIGTTSPNRLLTLSGSTSAYAAFNSSNYNNYSVGATSLGFIVYDDTTTSYRMAVSKSSAANSQISIFSDAPTFNDSYNSSLYIGNYQSNIATNGRAIGYRLLTSNAGSDVDAIFNIQYAYMNPASAVPPNAYSTIFSLTKAGVITSLGTYANVIGATNRDLYVDSSGSIGYISSIRASKKNITSISDVSWLNSLNTVSFNRRKKDEDGNYLEETYNELEYGLIAEDVEVINDELCFYDIVDGEKELRGVHYNKLIAPMLKMIQELKAEIDILKNK